MPEVSVLGIGGGEMARRVLLDAERARIRMAAHVLGVEEYTASHLAPTDPKD